ncbi:C40 family peptidase [Niabella sp. CC-SYL272]|uniref:C40 family peptidase n=1 Tax=Niabella agricola TaxID=2891571 RepID=UPI001F2E8D2E|nr:C40 family peptidase [Niabella agricola]MCF3109959.1 C40 family peptidase [Niabella agricola]
MMKPPLTFFIVLLLFLSACTASKKTRQSAAPNAAVTDPSEPSRPMPDMPAALSIDRPLPIDRKAFIAYAKSFLGTPYKYGSADPDKGFDCSGFLYHIFQHYRVKSPRSSYNYEHAGREISPQKALPGDLILFRGENSRRIGHIGIITATEAPLSFIHAAGTGSGVIISTFSGYYKKQFVKIIRVLE